MSSSASTSNVIKNKKNPKLKVAYITPISRNSEAFYNFTQPKRVNTSTTRSRERERQNSSTTNNTNNNVTSTNNIINKSTTYYKKNNSRDSTNYINISNCKRSSYIKTDYSYTTRPSAVNRSSSYIKGTCYLKSPYNYGNVINMYHIYNTSRGVTPCVSYRNATPQNTTYNHVHKQLMRSTSTTQQLVSKKCSTQRNARNDVVSASSNNNLKVFSCVMKDNNNGDCNRMNTQSSYCSNSCTFSQNSLFRNSCDNGIIPGNTVNAKKNSITKTKESSSQNSNSNTTSSKGRERINKELYKKKIDTPEELHFFYVHVIQNGKQYENKF